MAEGSQDPLTVPATTLDLLPEPMVLVRGGRVVFANATARSIWDLDDPTIAAEWIDRSQDLQTLLEEAFAGGETSVRRVAVAEDGAHGKLGIPRCCAASPIIGAGGTAPCALLRFPEQAGSIEHVGRLSRRLVDRSERLRHVTWEREHAKAQARSLARANRELEADAHHDPLTGLENRHSLNATMDRVIRDARRELQPLAVALVDIDHFKRVNDEHGHLLGDEALRLVAATIANHARRPLDCCYRYGGEEFLLLMPRTRVAGAMQIGEAIRRRIAELTAGAGPVPPLTVSIGLTIYDGKRTVDAATLIETADSALYAAKDAGRNRVRLAALPLPPPHERGQSAG